MADLKADLGVRLGMHPICDAFEIFGLFVVPESWTAMRDAAIEPTACDIAACDAGGATIFSIAGGALPPSNGNQGQPATNRRVNFIAGTGEVITGLRLRSEGVAFEFDSFAATEVITPGGGAVPEPATWAMLLAGFGLVGVSARRRRRLAA
jgi:hypothetical protein